MASPPVPSLRVRAMNAAPVRADGAFVLYWMVAQRRVGWNFALDRALEWVRELGRPLVVLEALDVDYPWASDRLHRFVLDGMVDPARRLRGKPVLHYPYVEPAPGAGRVSCPPCPATSASDRPRIRWLGNACRRSVSFPGNTARKLRVREYLRRYGP